MKRLLLLVALALPSLGLYSCVSRVKVPTANTIVKEAHEAFPSLPEVREIPLTPELTPTLPAPQGPLVKPKAPRVDHPRRALPARPVPRPRPPVDQAPVEELPPQEGVICIFPFGLIPNCTPEPAGRRP
jgi:hypothetical protein